MLCVAGIVHDIEVLHEGGTENEPILAVELLLDDANMAHFLLGLSVDIVEKEALGWDCKCDIAHILVSATEFLVEREGEFERSHLFLDLLARVVEVAPIITGASDKLVSVFIAKVIVESFPGGIGQGNVRVARVDESVLMFPDIVGVEASAVKHDLEVLFVA